MKSRKKDKGKRPGKERDKGSSLEADPKPSRQTSLADSAFWRDLETKFRALQPSDKNDDGLCAEWDSRDRWWPLHYLPSADVLQRFKQNAEFAAKVGFNQRSNKPIDSWLELLKRETDAFYVEGNSDTRIKNKKVRYGKYGSIQRVCEVSATYCERLANEAFAREKPAQQDRSVAPRTPRLGPKEGVKGTIAEIKKANPGISHLEICAKLDALNDRPQKKVSPRGEWMKLSGEYTWIGVLKNPKSKGAVKTYLSRIHPA